jgi:hypothetical protein
MTVRKTKGITLPAAPLVWDAVEFAKYAQARLDSREGAPLRSEIEESEICRADRELGISQSLAEWVTEWVVVHARPDVLYLAEFARQLKGLYEAIDRAVHDLNEVMDSPEWYMPHGLAMECLCLFLVLRGESAVRGAVECPSTLATMIYDEVAVYRGDIVYGAATRLFEKPPHYGWDMGAAIAHLVWGYPEQIAPFIKDGVAPWRWDELRTDTMYGPAIEALRRIRIDGPCGAPVTGFAPTA